MYVCVYIYISILSYLYVCVCVAQSCLTLWDHMDCNPPGSSVHRILQARILVKVKAAQSFLTLCDRMDYTAHGILQARKLEWVAFPFSRYLPNPGIEPRFSALQVNSLRAEPQGKPKNTRLGSLSLLQGNFLTQGLNPGLLHCRHIFYHLSHQGSPIHIYYLCLYLYPGSS